MKIGKPATIEDLGFYNTYTTITDTTITKFGPWSTIYVRIGYFVTTLICSYWFHGWKSLKPQNNLHVDTFNIATFHIIFSRKA